MSEPVHIAAIDAGSNAVRLSVVRAHSAVDLEPLHDERYPLRLGEGVFVRHRFSEEIFKKAVKAFSHFQEVMKEFGVTRYRAVATSASREAKNRDAFIRRIRQESKVRLEVISSHEESRLGREAVFAALGPESPLSCVVDLGGGSLELSILRDHAVVQSAQLPVGTVRLMTTLGINGVVSPAQADQVRKYLRALLDSKLTPRPNLGGELAIALGGNAESLADLAPGPREHGLSTLELSLLRERLPDLLRRDIDSRMKIYGVRRDRADVMGIAGLIFLTLGRYLNLRTLAIPRVGIREGLLREIAREAFSRKEPHRYDADSRQMLSGTRVFARRLDSDRHHAEHIRELSLQLFDQLQPVHHLPADARRTREDSRLGKPACRDTSTACPGPVWSGPPMGTREKGPAGRPGREGRPASNSAPSLTRPCRCGTDHGGALPSPHRWGHQWGDPDACGGPRCREANEGAGGLPQSVL